VAIGPTGEIWIDKKRVDATSVRSHIEKLHSENPKGGLVVQADRSSTNEKLMAVLNAARAAGMREVAISTDTN
jgi:biopolymer transport protein ExbD